MKLLQQIRLFLKKGRSDKVYEVDLCELDADRFVVNVRYGRRGSTLRDGSKTPLPVSRAEAERVYEKLVESKVRGGYSTLEPGSSEPSAEEAATPTDSRHLRLIALLGDQGTGRWAGRLDAVIHRVGELRVPGATGVLVSLLDRGNARRSYNVVRALMRCGTSEATAPLTQLVEDESVAANVRALAAHAVLELSPESSGGAFWDARRQAIPEALWQALRQGSVDALVEELREQPELLEGLYLTHLPEERARLLELLRQVPLHPPLWQPVRRIFKAAEARSDGDVFGELVRRLHTTAPSRHAIYGGRVFVRGHRVKRDGRRHGYTSATRTYFIRRTWRTLARLGAAGMAADYTALASGVLRAMTNEDAHPSSYAGRFSGFWAFGNILYLNHVGAARGRRSFRVSLRQGAPLRTRCEGFAELWDQVPDAIISVLLGAMTEEAQHFAVRALRANSSAWDRIATRTLLELFGSPFEGTAELAAEIAVGRYDPKDPDFELVLALADCPHARAREQALQWIRANPPVFLGQATVVVGLILSGQADTRRTILDVLGATAMPAEQAATIVNAVVSHALAVKSDEEGEATTILRDAAGVLLSAFSQELRRLDLGQVQQLLRSPVEGVAELGAKVLLGHDTRPIDLTDELLVAAMTSGFAVVRGIGIRLYGELPDDVLAQRFRVLCDLIVNRHADVRAAARPLVARLASQNPGFARVVAEALVPALCIAGPEGMHDDVVKLFRQELQEGAARLPVEMVLRMLRATEGVVQELGGDLLRAHVDPRTLTLPQIAGLASSDVVAIRRASWAMFESRVAEAAANVNAVLQFLDASWEDSRQEAFRIIDAHVGEGELPADLVIAVCDSVRADVQAYGRRLVTRMFGSADGPVYLLKLAQHPAPDMQAFASAWLDVHGTGSVDQLERLVPYLVGVMTRPNQGAVAKTRVMAFLEHEAEQSAEAAELNIGLLAGLAASEAKTWRAWAIFILAKVRRKFPDLPSPLAAREVPVWTRRPRDSHAV